MSHDETLISGPPIKFSFGTDSKKIKMQIYSSQYGLQNLYGKPNQNLRQSGTDCRKTKRRICKTAGTVFADSEKVEQQQNNISRQNPHGGQLLKKKMHAVKSMERRFDRQKEEFLDYPEQEDAIFLRFAKECAVPGGKKVLEYSEERLEAGRKVLAENLLLRIQGPQHVGIVGRNGCRKATSRERLPKFFWKEKI